MENFDPASHTKISDTITYDKGLFSTNSFYTEIRNNEADSNLLGLLNDILICYYSISIVSKEKSNKKTILFSILNPEIENKPLLNYISVNLAKMLESKRRYISADNREYSRPRWFNYVGNLIRHGSLYLDTEFPYSGLDKFSLNFSKSLGYESNHTKIILFSISAIMRNSGLLTDFCKSCDKDNINNILEDMYKFYSEEKKRL